MITKADIDALRRACENDPDGKVKGPAANFLALLSRLALLENVREAAFNLRNDNHLGCRGGEKCRMGPNLDEALAACPPMGDK